MPGPQTSEMAWLFTRGAQSVRIVRTASEDRVRLDVHGPGEAAVSRVFDDVTACVRHQSDLERRLLAQGFALEQFTAERRSAGDPARIPGARDRRRR